MSNKCTGKMSHSQESEIKECCSSLFVRLPRLFAITQCLCHSLVCTAFYSLRPVFFVRDCLFAPLFGPPSLTTLHPSSLLQFFHLAPSSLSRSVPTLLSPACSACRYFSRFRPHRLSVNPCCELSIHCLLRPA